MSTSHEHSRPTAPQVEVPYPPHGADDSPLLRLGPREPAGDSYRHNIIRLQVGDQFHDVLPAADDGAVSVSPAAVFADGGPVHVLSGCNSYGRLVTPTDNALTQHALQDSAQNRQWVWYRTALFPPGREWLETGVAVRGMPLEDLIHYARYHGQPAVLTWDTDGLRATATRIDPSLRLDPAPVPVQVRPAGLGCPMRFGDESGVCRPDGGPYGSRAIAAFCYWQQHRRLLVEALGCSVCAGRPVSSGRAIALTSSFTPSRHGGWQSGPPLPLSDLLDDEDAEGDGEPWATGPDGAAT